MSLSVAWVTNQGPITFTQFDRFLPWAGSARTEMVADLEMGELRESHSDASDPLMAVSQSIQIVTRFLFIGHFRRGGLGVIVRLCRTLGQVNYPPLIIRAVSSETVICCTHEQSENEAVWVREEGLGAKV